MMRRTTVQGVPPWRGVVARLLAMTLAVCAVSVAVTAWLVVRITDAAIEEVNGQNLQDDAFVYDVLIDWAAAHPDWSQVQPLVERLANRTQYRILLTDNDGGLLADSQAGGREAATNVPEVDLTQTRAIVDPGQVDWSLLQHAPGEEASPRRTIPPTSERSPEPVEPASPSQANTAVAPPARLFITGREPVATTFVDLSAPSRGRIMAVAALVVVVAAGASIAAGLRITRPLRELTAAARRMTDGDDQARAEIHTRDEIGEVAAAFNSLAERRSDQERLRREMVGDVAHELRTPLSSVRGWLEAAQDGLTPTDRRLVDSLHEEALHLQRLVGDLQDLALGDAGELRLHPEPTNLGALLERVVQSHDRTAADKGVTLRAVAEPGLVVDADPVRLRQAVTNLVANALRHTATGGSVQVVARSTGKNVSSTTATTRAGTHVAAIEVTDSGEGIAAADLPHVFERFWRADRSRSRGTGGSGLGLAIVRSVIELHGGSVGVTSTLGAGSSFTLRLPAHQQESRATRDRPPPPVHLPT